MKQLLELIYSRFDSGDVKAAEDLYYMSREAMKTDEALGVEWLKILSEDIMRRIPLSKTDEELRFLFGLHKRVLLAAAPYDFDSYLLYIEWNREPDKKFYPPRRKVLKQVVDALQELADDKLDLLAVSLPPGNAVLPYAIALAKVIRMLASAIASFFGFSLPEVDYSGISAGAGAVGDLANGANDATDGLANAAKAAKKLKNATLGIDELNILSENDSSGSGLGGSDLGIELPEYDFLGDLVNSKVDEIVKMITDAMNEITAVVSGFTLAIGTILVVTGANIPLGLGLMAVGAVGLAATIAANWNTMSERLAKTLTLVTSILGGFLLAIGAFLVFSGVNVPLGAGLMVAGATAFATAATINWKFLEGDLTNALSILTGIVSGALLAMGALFAFTGVSVPLGIALMAAGAVGLVTAVGLNWDSMSDPMRKAIGTLEAIVGGALLTFGAILALTGVNVPLGVGMIAAGAVSLVSGVALNWDSITGKIKDVLKKIGIIAGAAMLAIGVILCLTGVGIPLGVALIAAGAASLVSGVALNWDTIQTKVKEGLGKISEKFGEFKTAVGEKLEGAKEKITTWAGNVKEYFTKGADGKNAIDNIKEAASEWGESFKTGLSEKVSNAKSWVKEKITNPVSKAIKNSKAVEMAVDLKNNASELWEKAKGWWEDATEDGLSLETGVELVKSGWTTVKDWIGNIPLVQQAVSLIKSGCSSVKEWIGNIPTLSQAINLIKSGWTTVKDWIGNIPAISQGISLIKSGWTTVKGWINTDKVSVGVSLFKSGWSSLSKWIGTSISVGVSLFKDGWSSIRSFFGLSSGGYNTGHGWQMFEQGGFIKNGRSEFWKNIPM